MNIEFTPALLPSGTPCPGHWTSVDHKFVIIENHYAHDGATYKNKHWFGIYLVGAGERIAPDVEIRTYEDAVRIVNEYVSLGDGQSVH